MSGYLTAVLIGAGNRGYAAYGPYALAHPDEIRFVAVAEPDDFRRARFAEAHDIPRDRQYRSWEDALSRGRIADTALVCTTANLHVAPTVAAMRAGYDVLLEKPMAITLPDCLSLVQAAGRTGRVLQVCHVLRYAPFFSVLHDIVASGRLGDVIAVEHRENLAYWSMGHLYVRSSWGNSEVDGAMLLTKCCHDLDVLHWNLGRCVRLASSGSLIHYRAENAPAGAPERCTDGCPVAETCTWYAPRLYLDLAPLMHMARRSDSMPLRLVGALALDYPWLVNLACRVVPPLRAVFDYQGPPISTYFDDPSREGRLRALQTGPYGRCVYRCGSDMLDYQTVNMEFEGGTSAVLVMHGHSQEQSRTVRYDGTRATLVGEFVLGRKDVIEIRDHLTGRVERITPTPEDTDHHGGGDAGVMAAFVQAVRNSSRSLSTARESWRAT
jgi:predicted dehydrogenase